MEFLTKDDDAGSGDAGGALGRVHQRAHGAEQYLGGARAAQRAATAAAAAGRERLATLAANRDFEEVERDDHGGLEALASASRARSAGASPS